MSCLGDATTFVIVTLSSTTTIVSTDLLEPPLSWNMTRGISRWFSARLSFLKMLTNRTWLSSGDPCCFATSSGTAISAPLWRMRTCSISAPVDDEMSTQYRAGLQNERFVQGSHHPNWRVQLRPARPEAIGVPSMRLSKLRAMIGTLSDSAASASRRGLPAGGRRVTGFGGKRTSPRGGRSRAPR